MILLEQLNGKVAEAFARWCDGADASSGQPWGAFCRLAARTWLRDGEVFVIHDQGEGLLDYQVRTYEPDYCPFDATLVQGGAQSQRTIMGIELNAADQVVAYYFYRNHPEDIDTLRLMATEQLLRVPAEMVSHVRTITRLGQLRGTSVLAPAITRLADVAEYEGSEQAAAKVASAVSVAITRAPDFATSVLGEAGERQLELQPGMILDNLNPGEKYEVIDTSRPNPELSNYRRAMLRAAAAGIGVSYSSMTRDYDGTYSSQRQELAETRLDYDDVQAAWKAAFLTPVYTRFVQQLVRAAPEIGLTGFGRVDPMTLFTFDTQRPASPWIDPAKEAQADKLSLEMGIESRTGIMRMRGKDPRRVDQEREADQMSGVAPVEVESEPDEREAAAEDDAQT